MSSPHEETAEQPNAQVVRTAHRKYVAPLPTGHDEVVWDHASGSKVWDVDGNEFIDFTSGVIVANAGHAHPLVATAVSDQAQRLLNCYDAPHALRAKLAERLLELAGPPFDIVCFQVTGSEGIEAALRIAKLHTQQKEVLCFTGSYHGKTLAALSLSGVIPGRSAVGPLMEGSLESPFADCYRCPLSLTFPECGVACADEAWGVAKDAQIAEFAAVIAEPILGVGGAVVPPPEFWTKIRRFADEHGALFILDEVQSAFGRSGRTWFAFQQFDVLPDIVVAGKGIASGLPMSVVITRRELLENTPPALLTSTYAGNPLSCAAALATLEVLSVANAPAKCQELADVAFETLRSWSKDHPELGDVRGLGLNIGLDIVKSGSQTPDASRARQIYLKAVANRILVLPPTGIDGNVLRLAPPLLIDESLMIEGLSRLKQAFEDAA